MKKKLYMVVVLSVLTLILAVASAFIKPIYGSKLTNVEALFENENGITVTTNQELPLTFNSVTEGTVERQFDLGKKGVLLTSQLNGSSVDLSETFQGNFEMSFRAYSDTSHHDVTGTDWNSSTIPMSPYADLKEVVFEFVDKDNQRFAIAITAGEKWNTVTPAARVLLYNAQMGYHYANDALIPSDTATKNAGGYYTRIGGATFVNVAYRNGLTSDLSKPVTFGFNKDTMEIYVLHYERNTSDTPVYRVVLDLDDPTLGLRQLKSFNDYQVSIKMTSIASGKLGKMLIYDINGQSLENDVIQNNIGPDINLLLVNKGIVNNRYDLPVPNAYDLIEGSIAFHGTVTVKNAAGDNVLVYDSEGQTIDNDIYQENIYFIPSDAGNYTISYTGYDSDNLAGKTRQYVVPVYDQALPSTYDIKGNYQGIIENTTLGIGTQFIIYPGYVTSPMLIKSDPVLAKITLYKDGLVYQNIDKVSASVAETVVLNEQGNYQLIYSTLGFEQVSNQHIINFTVSNQVPTFTPSMDITPIQGVNSVVLLPTMSAEYNGQTKTATMVLYGPSGDRITLSGNTFTPTVIGDYRIVYMVNFGKTYSYSQYFTVSRSTNNLLTSTSRTVSIETNSSVQGDFPNQTSGIKVTAGQENDTVNYQTVIDVTNNTKNDSLIDLMVLPSVVGQLDLFQFTVRLTDLHNPKNFITIIVYKGSWGNQWSYVKAGANNQMPAGWENGNVLTAYNTGTPVGFSFTGEANMNAETLTLYYDNQEKAVYVSNIKRPGYSYGNQVIDFDDPNCFSEKLLWNGFTTGEVLMSVSFQSIQAGSASVLIKSINNVDMSGEWINDVEGPTLFLDLENYSEMDLPRGEVNLPYDLFEARAYDKIDGTINHTVKVYKDYQTLNQKEYPVTNHQFTPDSSGQYSLVYRAVDQSGNVGTKVIKINVVTQLDALDYQFNEPLTTNEFVGNYITIPSGIALGGSGIKDVIIQVKSPSDKLINLQQQTFLVNEVGEYSVVITVKDFLNQTITKTITITASLSAYPIIQDITIPSIYIEGIEYQLPDFDAFDYYTNPGVGQLAHKKIEVEINGVTQILSDTRKFTPLVTSHQEAIKIRYIASSLGSDLQTVLEFNVHVLKVKNQADEISLGQYFLKDQISNVQANSASIDFMTTTDLASITFANPVIAHQMRLDLSVPGAQNQFNQINIYLADSLNPDITVKISIFKNSSNTAKTSYLSINDGKKVNIAGSFYDVTTYGFSLQFNATSNYLIDLNASQLLEQIKETASGNQFNGFPSGKVNIKYQFEGVTGDSTLRVISIGNQVFSNDTVDRIRPQIQLSGFLSKVAEINQPFVIPSAIASDILDPNVSLSLTIRSLTKTIYSGSIDEDYVFTPTEYGIFRFIYTATDSSNRKLETTYLVTVKDRIPPVITLVSQVQTTAVINQLVTLPGATVTDNHDTEVQLWIFVTTPKGVMTALETGNTSFTPKESGIYTVTYYAQDSYNSYTYQQYTILVP